MMNASLFPVVPFDASDKTSSLKRGGSSTYTGQENPFVQKKFLLSSLVRTCTKMMNEKRNYALL
jgi:hypothetical protein